jgi:aldose sugar dehydrogenase
MLLNSIEQKIIFSIRKCNLILTFFIYTILIFIICNLVNNDLDDVFGVEKESPMVHDQNLQISQFTTEQLNFPTGLDFLDEDDILVIEKNTGQVKRILDGEILNEPVLDVNVDSSSERGLLGIAILNTKILTTSDITTNEQPQQENNLDNEVKVFLFYTETADVDNGNILGNRLYKYDFIDGKLVNPKLLLDLPFLPGPAHNGGVLELGPDKNLYLVVGDLYLVVENINHPNYQKYVTLAQNVEDSKLPDGRGGVLRLTVDGDPLLDNDFSSLERNYGLLNFYYGYGIRNSFGIGFDPLTGILWETENGPDYGDEINVILPGFNGGWTQVLGLSTEYENFTNKEFDRSKIIGTYYDPVFTWVTTVAPTAITFIDSKIFGEEYENDLLVGSTKQGGRIFHFNLNETRTGLDLPPGELVDKMADVDEELEAVTLGRNFGVITDIEINPYDGIIYIVDGQTYNGKIYQIHPKELKQVEKTN